MDEVKDQGHIVDPASNQCTSFLFYINWTNHSCDMANRVFDRIPQKSKQVISISSGM